MALMLPGSGRGVAMACVRALPHLGENVAQSCAQTTSPTGLPYIRAAASFCGLRAATSTPFGRSSRFIVRAELIGADTAHACAQKSKRCTTSSKSIG